MRKRNTATVYVVGWIAGVLAVALFFTGGSVRTAQGTVSAVAATPAAEVATFVIVAATVLMIMTWAAALVALARQRAWDWCVAVLILQLVGLGIVGMVAYGLAGPERPILSVTRPSLT